MDSGTDIDPRLMSVGTRMSSKKTAQFFWNVLADGEMVITGRGNKYAKITFALWARETCVEVWHSWLWQGVHASFRDTPKDEV